MTAQALAGMLKEAILYPLIGLMFAGALLVFIWGIIEFLFALQSGSDATEGNMPMVGSIVRLFIRTVAVAIVGVIAGTFNLPVPR